MQRKSLGKGLSALIPESAPERSERVIYLNVDQIRPNRYQPRGEFNPERLKELAGSIKQKGVVQPIVVTPREEDSYELVAGERRLRAVKSLGYNEIPAIVKKLEPQALLEFSLIENLQRQNLNHIEEAKAFSKLIDEFGFTHEKVAQVVTKDRATISNTLRLLNLPTQIQEAVSAGKLSMGHARALLSIEDEYRRLNIFKKTVKDKLSVRELENMIGRKASVKKHLKKHSHRDPHMVEIEEKLQRALGTKVRIQHKAKRGNIQIEYYSLDDLERLVSKLISKKT